MEPLRTKQCVVLLVVFALALGITPGCKPSASDKPTTAEKKTEKKVDEKTTKTAEKQPQPLTSDQPRSQAEGAVSKQAVAEAPQVGLGKKTSPSTPDAAEAMPPEAEYDDIPRAETPEETARRLGPPLVEHPQRLLRLDKVDSIWLDKPAGRLIMVGEVCQRRAPLEMFVCLWHTKEHESVLTVRVPAHAAHAGLLALGAKAGGPVQFMPKYIPASGSVIDIDVIWKDSSGKIQKKRGQEWIRNVRTKKPMEFDWVFAGSGFWTDQRTGRRHYQAESGDFICVSNFPTAMLDLPVKSTQQNEGLMFMALTENIPPLGTPVTIVLKPRLDKRRK